VDIEKFDKFSDQFDSMLIQLKSHEKAMLSAAHSHPLADTAYLSECASQVSTEKHLTKIGNDIRALGFCYNNLRASMQMNDEQFQPPK
jgi:hypothetical protein